MTRLLAELGAEVIKIESAQHYDGSRSMMADEQAYTYERSSTYNFFNCNKLGITSTFGTHGVPASPGSW